MDFGPVDVLVVEFPGSQFQGEIGPALGDLLRGGVVRVLDLLFVAKDDEGVVSSVELAGLGPDLRPAFVDVDGVVPGGLLEPDDVEVVGEGLAPGSSAALIVWENTWAIPFVRACEGAGGRVVDQARIPADAVRTAMEALQG
jgi:hypothetical protein